MIEMLKFWELLYANNLFSSRKNVLSYDMSEYIKR